MPRRKNLTKRGNLETPVFATFTSLLKRGMPKRSIVRQEIPKEVQKSDVMKEIFGILIVDDLNSSILIYSLE